MSDLRLVVQDFVHVRHGVFDVVQVGVGRAVPSTTAMTPLSSDGASSLGMNLNSSGRLANTMTAKQDDHDALLHHGMEHGVVAGRHPVQQIVYGTPELAGLSLALSILAHIMGDRVRAMMPETNTAPARVSARTP